MVRTVARNTMAAATAAPATGEGVCTTVRTAAYRTGVALAKKLALRIHPYNIRETFFRLHILLGVWRFYAPT